MVVVGEHLELQQKKTHGIKCQCSTVEEKKEYDLPLDPRRGTEQIR